ncbi:hypothetical protein ACHAQI_005583 [Fusarium lateritium]
MAGELKNIYYINFVPDGSGIDRDTQSKLDAFKENVELTSQFTNTKANISVKDKITSGQLKNEAVATAAYKAKVVTYLASNTPWMEVTSAMNDSKHFETDKTRFHQELVSTFTKDLGLSPSITSRVEGVLAEIKQAITTANQSGNGADKLQIAIVMNVFSMDEIIGSWQCETRTIGFRPDESLITYIRTKHETTKANVSFQYSMLNAKFNERKFHEGAKEAIQKIPLASVQQATDQHEIEAADGESCSDSDHKASTGHAAQQPSSTASSHGTESSSGSQRKRRRTTSDDGNDKERNTDTATKSSPQEPVRGYISWLTKRSAEVQKDIDSSQGLDDSLKYYQELKKEILSQEGKHQQKVDILVAQFRAIEKDEQDNIAIRNVILPIIQRRGTDCAEEWRAALNRCNTSLQIIEERKDTIDDQIDSETSSFVSQVEECDERISDCAEDIEDYARKLAQDKRTKRAIHIMKKLVEMGESGMATSTEGELDGLEKWIGRLAARKPIEDSD